MSVSISPYREIYKNITYMRLSYRCYLETLFNFEHFSYHYYKIYKITAEYLIIVVKLNLTDILL